MFSRGSRSSISLATVTPSLVMIGAPNFFSITALRPLGPSVILTASANRLTPRRIAWREFSPVTICLAIMLLPPQSFEVFRISRSWYWCLPLGRSGLGRAAELRENFFFAQDQVFFVLNFDFAAAVLAEQDAIAHFDVQRNALALFDF